MGNVVVENRNGLVVATEMTPATGAAEREAAIAMVVVGWMFTGVYEKIGQQHDLVAVKRSDGAVRAGIDAEDQQGQILRMTVSPVCPICQINQA
jgi:hypothetical protein